MKVDGKHYKTIWIKEDDERIVQIIDQWTLQELALYPDRGSASA